MNPSPPVTKTRRPLHSLTGAPPSAAAGEPTRVSHWFARFAHSLLISSSELQEHALELLGAPDVEPALEDGEDVHGEALRQHVGDEVGHAHARIGWDEAEHLGLQGVDAGTDEVTALGLLVDLQQVVLDRAQHSVGNLGAVL